MEWGHSFIPDLYLCCFQPSTRGLLSNPEEFAKAGNDVVLSVRSLYMPIEDMLEEPAEVVNAPLSPKYFKYISL